MPARLTKAEAKRLGLDVPDEATGKRKRTTRKTGKGPYLTICHDCQERFTTQAAEDRHLNETRHARYDFELKAATDEPAAAATSDTP